MHATKTAFGQTVTLCDDARRFLLQRAREDGGEGFTLRFWNTDNVTCPDCSLVLAQRSAFALPAPVIHPGPTVKNPIGRQIAAQMRKRYGPSIDDPEWATEAYR